MSYSDKGIKKILRFSFVYQFLQVFVGNKKVWWKIVVEFIKPTSRKKILDIGCGTSAILEFLHGHEVQYSGYDFNEKYINDSRNKWSEKGEYNFNC
jgi:ubiquinone/menaquinone biosynthesis C-methylase UbiE